MWCARPVPTHACFVFTQCGPRACASSACRAHAALARLSLTVAALLLASGCAVLGAAALLLQVVVRCWEQLRSCLQVVVLAGSRCADLSLLGALVLFGAGREAAFFAKICALLGGAHYFFVFWGMR